VVGTDGSESSLRAVDRAGAIALITAAKWIVATAHLPSPRKRAATPSHRGAPTARTTVGGEAPFYRILRDARERARIAGATNVEEKSIFGAPITALVDLAEEVHADLLVIGNGGLSSVAGRLLGSVPSEVLPQGQDRRADRPHHRRNYISDQLPAQLSWGVLAICYLA